MMAHQSKLKPWIPFYIYTLKDNKPDPAYYSTAISEDFPVRVAEGLYLRKNYHYTIYDSIIRSPLLKTSAYKYSDLGFYFITEMIKNIINQPIEEYADRNFYRPMGLSTMGYLPLKHFSRERIVPTEFDTAFRKQLLHGDVHDQGAAMLGGVSGHAGLFSNANDLGIIGNMLLQKGSYGEVEYIRPETIEKFTAWQFPLNDNRRGIGFDKPLPEYDENGPACKSASPESYGHSGFTGTYFWTDPQNDLVYIFLSNRIHPDAGNTRLSQMNIRPKIHQCLYDAIEKSTNFGQ
jgi:CubicO group peptidase (beta-lactamase class C family)